MAPNGILTRDVDDPTLRATIVGLATAHLVANGDTNVVITQVEHNVSDSSGAATVYEATFERDAGSAVLSVTFLANGQHLFQEN